MTQTPDSVASESPWRFILFACTVPAVLGLTLAVYPTTLNPGLPLVLGGCLASLWAIIRLLRGVGLYYHWATEVAMLLGLWMAVSAVQGLDAYLGQRSLATYVGALGFLIAAQCAIGSLAQWQSAAHGLVGFLSLVCLFAWPACLREGLATGNLSALTGTFNNPDAFAVIPMVALVLGFGLVERAGPWRPILLAQLAFLFLSLAATGCRAALVGMVVAAIFFFAGLASQRKSHLANVKFLLALPLLVAMMMLPAANLDIPVLGKWARTISAHTAQTEEVRLEVLSRGWRAVALRPVLGSGPGAFGLSYQTVRSPQRDQNEFINLAHNDYIEMAVETGVVGFILWLWLFLAAGGLLWKRLKTGRQPVQAAGVLGALVALGTFSVFNFIVSERPIFWLQFLVLGLALSFPSSRQRTVELKVVRYGSSLLLLGLGLWATQFGWQSLRADTFVTQADENSRNLQLEEASRNLDRAIALQPYRAGLYQKRADVSLRLAALSDDQRHELACVYYLGKAREASPKNIAVLIQLSDAYGRLQDFPRQAEVLQAAAQIAPGHAAIVERTAAASIRSGQLQGAVKVLEPLALRKGGAPLQQLAALTLALERQKTGQGLAVAQRVVQTAAPERAKEYFDLVASSCEAQRYWAFAGQIAELRLGSAPDDFCLHRQLATAVGQKEGKAAEFALLDKAVRSVDTIEQPCAQEVLARWVELGLGRGQASAMSSHLAQLGASHERTPWLSIPRSEVFLHQGRVAEAALVLNHGLEISPYSYELLMQAGKVQEAAGHQDLALNSYRQALDSRPGDGPAQQGIDRLLQR